MTLRSGVSNIIQEARGRFRTKDVQRNGFDRKFGKCSYGSMLFIIFQLNAKRIYSLSCPLEYLMLSDRRAHVKVLVSHISRSPLVQVECCAPVLLQTVLQGRTGRW